MTALASPCTCEWLETDGLGGFASGTVSGRRTRRYHALLLANAPTGRFVLVNCCDVWVETPGGTFAISEQRYGPIDLAPAGNRFLSAFERDPWPRWMFTLEDGTRIGQELFAIHDAPAVGVRWRLLDPRSGVKLHVRPFLSGRDYHSLHHENSAFRFTPQRRDPCLVWQPYNGVPAIVMAANGRYDHQPQWYRNFYYDEEHARGLDAVEELAAPGAFHFDLSAGEAILLLGAEGEGLPALPFTAAATAPHAVFNTLRTDELKRRGEFAAPLHRAADAYIVRRGAGKTIIAGYPWFTDWGRDTFISLRGLCLPTGRLDDARAILLEWAGVVSEGMLPNRFPDQGGAPEYNSVDASLWYVIAAHDWLEAAAKQGHPVSAADQKTVQAAIEAILSGYARGTRYGIRQDMDGLLAAGVPGLQLTWMDAKVGDWVVTPRIGKPVEIQALWLNALWIAGKFNRAWQAEYERGVKSFRARFWGETAGYLFDVVDTDHRPGAVDATLRPNQVLAVGGLPLALLPDDEARRVVDAVEAMLWTPLGLRTLAPGIPGYHPRCVGPAHERDAAYHQGTAWAWLLGPFVEAWVRVRGGTIAAKREARRQFLAPLLQHLDEAGLGHVSEIADGAVPHTPRGCPFQAWSLGELLRLTHGVLAPADAVAPPAGFCAGGAKTLSPASACSPEKR